MKILFVTLFLPRNPASHAGSRYVFEQIKRLSSKHEIHLATRLEEGEEPFLAPLEKNCKKVHPHYYRPVARGKRSLWDKISLVKSYLCFSAFANRLVKKGNYDLVQVEWVETAILLYQRAVPMVLDAHDVITKPAQRLAEKATGLTKIYLTAKAGVVRMLELYCMGKFNTILTVSDFDKSFLLSMRSELNVQCVNIPAGLDISVKSFPVQKNSLLFLASYKYRPKNVEAALFLHNQVLPIVKKVVPDVQLILAGYGPPDQLLELAENESNVFVPGFVDDLDRCYKNADVFVAPIFSGGGVIVKILDAMAAGLPVVTTQYGNEGIKAKPGTDVLIADSAHNFARCIIELFENRALRDHIGTHGQQFIKQNYSADRLVAELEKVYEKILSRTH